LEERHISLDCKLLILYSKRLVLSLALFLHLVIHCSVRFQPLYWFFSLALALSSAFPSRPGIAQFVNFSHKKSKAE